MSDFDYTDKRVVVTGGATGVGAALLELLAELNGHDVTVLDIKEPTGPHKTFLLTDLSDRTEVDAAVAELPEVIDVLFNNAGVADTSPPETVFKVNVLALRRLSESLLPRISEGGAIVNTSSIAGSQWPGRLQMILELLAIDDWDAALEWFRGRDIGTAPYMFSKEVIQVHTMKLSRAAMAQGARVNSVCPGPIDTPLLVDFRQTMTDAAIDFTVKNSNGRLVSAREVASCLAWLGTPASSYVSGVNLTVDAGFGAAMTTGQVDISELIGTTGPATP